MVVVWDQTWHRDGIAQRSNVAWRIFSLRQWADWTRQHVEHWPLSFPSLANTDWHHFARRSSAVNRHALPCCFSLLFHHSLPLVLSNRSIDNSARLWRRTATTSSNPSNTYESTDVFDIFFMKQREGETSRRIEVGCPTKDPSAWRNHQHTTTCSQSVLEAFRQRTTFTVLFAALSLSLPGSPTILSRTCSLDVFNDCSIVANCDDSRWTEVSGERCTGRSWFSILIERSFLWRVLVSARSLSPVRTSRRNGSVCSSTAIENIEDHPIHLCSCGHSCWIGRLEIYWLERERHSVLLMVIGSPERAIAISTSAKISLKKLIEKRIEYCRQTLSTSRNGCHAIRHISLHRSISVRGKN